MLPFAKSWATVQTINQAACHLHPEAQAFTTTSITRVRQDSRS